MKIHTNTSVVLLTGCALALALAFWQPAKARAAESGDGKAMMTESNMMHRCQVMQEQHEKMNADTMAQDADLTAKVAGMNSAPEDAKLGRMAAILTQMVEQRTAMNARRAKMDEQMMQHMMGHMQMGAQSMAQCPMMKGMKGMNGKAMDAHKEHQAETK